MVTGIKRSSTRAGASQRTSNPSPPPTKPLLPSFTSTPAKDDASSAGKPETSTSAKDSPAIKKKLAMLKQFGKSPFPTFQRPTPEECRVVLELLSEGRPGGLPARPDELVDREGGPAGCGSVPLVLDALVRTILSQNTTSSNSTNAKNAMDTAYGRGNYRECMIQGVAVLKSTITCGGLAGTKSQAIIGILEFCDERQGGKGELSLEYLRQLSDMEIIETMMRFAGVGVKTVTCVMLLCMGRDFFAVDTHVFRISKSLGWLPSGVSDKDIAFNHLDDRIPPEYKFGLHVAFVEHGRGCVKCSANGNVTMCFVDTCKINHLVSRSSGGKSAGKGKAKGVSKGKGMSEKDLVEPTESDFLVPRQRTPSSVASPEEKPKPITSPTRVYKGLDIGSPALKTEHLVRDEKTPGGRARSSRKRATHDLGAEGQSPSSGKVPRLKTEEE